MVTSISVALCNMVRMNRLLEAKTATPWQPGSTSKLRACSHGSPRDELLMVCAYQKVLSNQSYTLRKRPAMIQAYLALRNST